MPRIIWNIPLMHTIPYAPSAAKFLLNWPTTDANVPARAGGRHPDQGSYPGRVFCERAVALITWTGPRRSVPAVARDRRDVGGGKGLLISVS
jgi:hypothetical protein